ncbi:hypothetical protein [Geodermatophilus sp. SYSU D01036]
MKLGLVVALLREVRPACPVAAAVLGVFGAYGPTWRWAGARGGCGPRAASTCC